MRDVLLSGTAGFLSSCAAAFAVHRALWKAADDQSRQLDQLAGHPHGSSASAPKKKLVSYILHDSTSFRSTLYG